MAIAERTKAVAQPSVRPTCPECETTAVWHGEYECVCEGCGLVVDERRLDFGPEWRSDDEDPFANERTGAPETYLLHDKGLSTTIDWRDRDANGGHLDADSRRRMARLRRWQRWTSADVDGGENLRVATNELARMASVLDVPDAVTESAAMLYRRALEADLLVGRSIEGVASAALYVACRSEGLPRSLDDVASAARIDRPVVGRMYRLLVAEFDLAVEPADPRSFVPRYCSGLDLGQRVERTARRIIESTVGDCLAGKSPTGFAAGAVYLAASRCGEARTQAEVAEVADVSTMTIRSHYQDQRACLERSADPDS